MKNKRKILAFVISVFLILECVLGCGTNTVYAAVSDIIYTKMSEEDPQIQINLNGKEIKKVTLGETTLTEGSDYSVSFADEVTSISLKASMLDGLEAGNYTVMVDVGSPNEEIRVNLTIQKAELKATDFIINEPDSLIYDGQQKTVSVSSYPKTIEPEDVIVKYYDQSGIAPAVNDGNDATTAPVNAGTYTIKLDVKGNDNYKEVSDLGDWKFTVAPITVSDIEPVETPIFEATIGQTLGEFLERLTPLRYLDGRTINGEWSWNVENETILDNVGENSFTAIFMPSDTINYDWSNVPGWNGWGIQISVIIIVSVDTESWGDESVRADKVKQYVVNDPNSLDYGKTSVVIAPKNIDENGVLWLREESDGKSAWYGVDFSDPSFDLRKGMRFYVQWLSVADDKYAAIADQLDEEQRGRIEKDNRWIFILGVEDQEGKKIQPKTTVNIYVQIGDDWDLDDLNAYFIAAGADEKIPVDHMEIGYVNGKSTFACMTISHFSPYIIFDELIEENKTDDQDSGNGNTENSENTGSTENSENSENTGSTENSESSESTGSTESSEISEKIEDKTEVGIQSPSTGDDSNVMLYSVMFTVSLLAVVVLFLAAKKRKQKNK